MTPKQLHSGSVWWHPPYFKSKTTRQTKSKPKTKPAKTNKNPPKPEDNWINPCSLTFSWKDKLDNPTLLQRIISGRQCQALRYRVLDAFGGWEAQNGSLKIPFLLWHWLSLDLISPPLPPPVLSHRQMDILALNSSRLQPLLGSASRRNVGFCHPWVPTPPPLLSGERKRIKKNETRTSPQSRMGLTMNFNYES